MWTWCTIIHLKPSRVLHVSWAAKPGGLRHLCAFFHQQPTHFKTLHILYFIIYSGSEPGWISGHAGDLIANNQVTSPLIKWCSKDLSFCLFGRVCTLRPSVVTVDKILMAVICNNLCSPFVTLWVCLLFFFPHFVSAPIFTQEELCRCKMTQWSFVWLLMLRKALSDSVFKDILSADSYVNIWTMCEV